MPRYFFKAWKDPRYNSHHYANHEAKYEAKLEEFLFKLRWKIWHLFRK